MSFERECRICELMLSYAGRLLADVPDGQLTAQPVKGVNPPVWILGHLIVTADNGLRRLGLPPLAPPGWREAFGQGSAPARGLAMAPTKQQLESALRAGYTALVAALRAADEAALAQRTHDSEFLRNSPLQSMADVLTHLATAHFAVHLGQLAYWRRCMGYPPMF